MPTYRVTLSDVKTNETLFSIPDGITCIGEKAFHGCKSLNSVTIPSSITSIGMLEFSGCTNLTSMDIPDSVTTIGGKAFFGCRDLTIHTPEGSYAESWAKENGIKVETF